MIADADAAARPATAPLATLATIAVYERLVAEKEAEIAGLRAEVEHLSRQLRSQQLSLRQAQALIAYLSERAAEQAGRPGAEAPVTAPLVQPAA